MSHLVAQEVRSHLVAQEVRSHLVAEHLKGITESLNTWRRCLRSHFRWLYSIIL
jgi:hypothetical protein